MAATLSQIARRQERAKREATNRFAGIPCYGAKRLETAFKEMPLALLKERNHGSLD
jgi:hypothetical protein